MNHALLKVLSGLLAAVALAAGEPSTQPILEVDTGTHTAMINRVGVDSAGRVLATASDDKTVRVWDVASGTLLGTLRPPVGEGKEGALYAGAMSPDGTLVAAGGWTGWEWDEKCCIYLFDRVSGRVVRRITGLSMPAKQLVFSPDGKRLGACLGTRSGMRIYRVSDGTELARDADYGDDSYGADFDRAGRLVTCSDDSNLRLYDGSGRLLSKVKVTGDPETVRFSPDGSRVAVGYYGRPEVEVRSGADLALLFTPDASGSNSDLSSVAWSLDGQTLYAGGKYSNDAAIHMVRVWSQGGRGPWTDHEASTDTVMDLAALPGGGLLWCGADASWGILGAHSSVSEAVSFRGQASEFRLDGPGQRVGFTLRGTGGRQAAFDVLSRNLTPGAAQGLSAPRTSAPGIEITNWNGERSPKLNGRPLPIKSAEMAFTRALGSHGDILLGTSWNLYAFDDKGAQRWVQSAPGAVWAINVSADGSLAVAGYGDGTIRWHRMTDGRELLAFFPHRDGRRWVAWTPGGYYDCSPGGEDLIGWHVNRGKDQAADFFPASRFRAQYYRPDVVARVLKDLDEKVALAGANAGAQRPVTTTLQAMLPPVVRILSPDNGARVQGGTATIRASVRAEGAGQVDAVWAAVDGRRVESRGISLQPGAAPGGGKLYVLEVPTPAQGCTVSVFAQSGSAVSEAAVVRLAGAGAQAAAPAATGFVIKPKLYVLAIGVSAYKRADLALDFPAKDARDLAGAFAAQKDRLFRDVEVKLLTDAEATRDNVMDGLEWLEHSVTAKDMAVMFLAGHGINDTGGQYYFLPVNADPERIKRTMVADSEVRSTLARLPGKVLFFLDTCHSGNILGGAKQRGGNDLNGFINELASAENGVVVFAASTGKQASQESKEWHNGAFTKAVVEGLSGKADFQHSGRVTVNMLDLYISERVKVLTRGTQAPTTAKPATVPDFPVAVVN